VTTLSEIPFALIARSSETLEAKREWARVFWINERIMQVLVLALLISLVYDATRHFRSRRTFVTGVVGVTVLFVVLSMSYEMYQTRAMPGSFRYMTPWTRDLNFFVALLNLSIWGLIIASHHKDRKLLLATGGLGIQFTGNSIGQALRDMSPTIVEISSDFVVIANLARIYIWWQAFRDPARPAPSNTLSK
jgi:hypothetical protein